MNSRAGVRSRIRVHCLAPLALIASGILTQVVRRKQFVDAKGQ